MKNLISTFIFAGLTMASAPASAALIEEMAAEFLNMPESALDSPEWKQNVSVVDIEQVPADVIAGLIAKGVVPSYNEEVNLRLVGDLNRIHDFHFFVREALVLNFDGGRVAGYAFAIDECTVEECYGFYGLYFFANGDLASQAL